MTPDRPVHSVVELALVTLRADAVGRVVEPVVKRDPGAEVLLAVRQATARTPEWRVLGVDCIEGSRITGPERGGSLLHRCEAMGHTDRTAGDRELRPIRKRRAEDRADTGRDAGRLGVSASGLADRARRG